MTLGEIAHRTEIIGEIEKLKPTPNPSQEGNESRFWAGKSGV